MVIVGSSSAIVDAPFNDREWKWAGKTAFNNIFSLDCEFFRMDTRPYVAQRLRVACQDEDVPQLRSVDIRLEWDNQPRVRVELVTSTIAFDLGCKGQP